MSKESIYIDIDEDIHSVVKKIASARAAELELVVPAGARVIQNIVDAHLIKEAGESNSKNLAIVTNDLMGRIFAERAGLSVIKNESEDNNSLAGDRVSSGRISDIVPRRRASPLKLPVAQAGTAQLAINKPESISASAVLTRSNSKKSSAVLKNAGLNKKGDAAVSFLNSYREERSKGVDFSGLVKNGRKRPRWPFRINSLSIVGAGAAAALVLAFIVFGRTLPRAEIIVYPVRDTASQNLEVLVSSRESQVDLEKAVIPGELVSLEKTENGEFTATGVKDVSEKARGKITIYNVFSSQPQTLIASRFQAEDGSSTGVGAGPATGGGAGKIFWTTKTLSVPGAAIKDGSTTPGQIEAEVVAAEAGEAYSISPARFSMPALKGTPRADKIYAVSTSPMTGGKVGQATVVATEDVNKAFELLKEKIKPQLQTLKQNLPAGFQFWPEAYNEELADSSAEPEAGRAANAFKATVRMVARAVIFKTQDLEVYSDQLIQSKLDSSKMLLTASKEISFLKPPVVDYQKGAITATLAVKYDVFDKFDAEAFKKMVLKKKEKEIKNILLNYKNIERVEVKRWPFWVRKVPANPERVQIKIAGM